MLHLIGLMLRRDIMIDGVKPARSKIVLDELGKELEKRDLAFCRFADDCKVFVKSQTA